MAFTPSKRQSRDNIQDTSFDKKSNNNKRSDRAQQ
jgi:hypothetical protein